MKRSARAITLFELLFLLSMLAGSFMGLSYAARQVERDPVILVLSFLGGGIAPLVVIGVAGGLCAMFWGWWRPFLPSCENGCCKPGDYKDAELSPGVMNFLRTDSKTAWTCKCGFTYTKTKTWSHTHFVRVLDHHSFRPYLVHDDLLGRWQVDEEDWLILPDVD